MSYRIERTLWKGKSASNQGLEPGRTRDGKQETPGCSRTKRGKGKDPEEGR